MTPLSHNDLRPFLRFHYRNFTGSISTFQHQYDGLLFFVRLHHDEMPDTFPCSDYPICACTSLGLRFEPASWNAPVTHYGFSYVGFLLDHTCGAYAPYAFLRISPFDPYVRGFVSPFGHSNHRCFVDPRHIGDTIHLWTAFVHVALAAMRRSLSADFTGLQTTACFRYGRLPEY